MLICAGREDVRAQFEVTASEATDLDTFMQEHATSMPRDLTEPQLLYAMALCVAEVAGASSIHCPLSSLWSLSLSAGCAADAAHFPGSLQTARAACQGICSPW